jgi:UDPglucose 6-dehydrogenase
MEAAHAFLSDVYFASDVYDLAQGCDAVALVTEWNEFKELDMARLRTAMRTPVLLDGRNIYDPKEMAALGFHYLSMGRASSAGVADSVLTNGRQPVSP